MLSDYPSIAVTGGSGWLGHRLVLALTEGQAQFGNLAPGGRAVRALEQPGQPTSGLLDLGVEPVMGDLRDPEALTALFQGCEGGLAFHIAGLIHPPGRTRYFDEINVEGTLKLLQAARAAKLRRLVVMSSNSPLGCNAAATDRFTEESPYNPYMGYGRSKHRMELLLRDAWNDPRGPEIVIARAPWFYGPGQPPRQSLFFTMIKNGKFPILGTGLNRRSMGYVDSLALGLLLCAGHADAAGQIYWLADEKPYSMLEIVETVRMVLKDDFGMPVVEKNPGVPSVVADVAQLVDATLQAAGLYHQKIHVLSEMNKTIACDITKAKTELGYEPLVELREGMRRSVAWCLENNQKI